MSTTLATAPADTTLADFDHCLEIAQKMIEKREPHGTYRAPGDEPARPKHFWQRPPECPAIADKFVVRLEAAEERAALIGVTLFDSSLETAVTERLQAILPPGKQVHRLEDDGPLYIFAFYPYLG